MNLSRSIPVSAVEKLSAQPVTGTATTKPLDPKELDDYFADQLSRKPFVGISVAVRAEGRLPSAKVTAMLQRKQSDHRQRRRFAIASVTKEFYCSLHPSFV